MKNSTVGSGNSGSVAWPIPWMYALNKRALIIWGQSISSLCLYMTR